MNVLSVGADPSALFPYIPKRNYLLIDDGSFAVSGRAKTFDPLKDQFNPLKAMSYTKARELRDIFSATFPEGENTLTKQEGLSVILNRLVTDEPHDLKDIVPNEPDKKEVGPLWAYRKVQELSLSPVLSRVFERNLFSFSGTIHAVLDRKQLGDFDCRLLGRLLMLSYPGTIVVPEFGFYAMPSHASLIAEGRLIAGIRSFDQVPALESELTMMETKIGSRCTPRDARTLAEYAGLVNDPLREDNDYHDFIQRCIA